MMSRLSYPLHPAYHLRPNKAVDRLLFVELLRVLESRCSLRQHTYIGLGGPFLEDFRLLAREFPYMHLVSVESDGETHKRQLFHRCSSRMECFPGSLGSFIESRFPSAEPVIVWADYTDISRESLSELSDMVRQAVPTSVIRITVRAESPVPKRLNLHKFYPPRVPPRKEKDFERIRRKYERDMTVDDTVFPPDWFEWPEFSTERFPDLVARMVRFIAQGACTGSKAFVPVHTVKYSDGTIMVSLTGVLTTVTEKEEVAEHFRDKALLPTADPEGTDCIDVPTLTTKERLHIEKYLPADKEDGSRCLKALGYLIDGDDSEEATIAKFAQFEKYHRLYPFFAKVVP